MERIHKRIITLSVILPSKKRSQLGQTLQSIWPELEPGDELLLDVNDDAPWGHRARNRQMPNAKGDYLLFFDDDDIYVTGAFSIIRNAIAEQPDRVHLFQVLMSGVNRLWTEEDVREGNVTTQMIAVPRDTEPRWTDRREGDYDFLVAAIKQHGEPIWHDEIVAKIRTADRPVITTPPKFPIVVPQPKGYTPVALWALEQEGYKPITREVDDAYGYGDLLAENWEKGDGFILVEHDVVPWWGALRELWECEEDWCVFPYPQGLGWPDPALGCVKFSTKLVAKFPRLHHELHAATWERVQEKILPALWNEGLQWHEHWPPVAHARQRKDP